MLSRLLQESVGHIGTLAKGKALQTVVMSYIPSKNRLVGVTT